MNADQKLQAFQNSPQISHNDQNSNRVTPTADYMVPNPGLQFSTAGNRTIHPATDVNVVPPHITGGPIVASHTSFTVNACADTFDNQRSHLASESIHPVPTNLDNSSLSQNQPPPQLTSDQGLNQVDNYKYSRGPQDNPVVHQTGNPGIRAKYTYFAEPIPKPDLKILMTLFQPIPSSSGLP